MKVLIADDEAVSRRLLGATLRRWGYDVVVAEDGFEAARILRSPDAPKLVILDWMMPGIDGEQLCREIREQKQEPYTYILLLTGKRRKSDVIQGLEAGADDYVIKPFDTGELKVRLRTGKRIIFLQTQLIEARDALRDMATRDALTGLWNRAAILDFFHSEIARAARNGAPVGLILLDVDHFKQVNDTYGHIVGDEVLRKVAQALRTTTRLYDAVGRYGGEEFLVVLPGCDETNSMSHAERQRVAVSQVTVELPERSISVTVSLGVAVFDPSKDTDAADLIAKADSALYLAKQRGRNRVEIGRDGHFPCQAESEFLIGI